MVWSICVALSLLFQQETVASFRVTNFSVNGETLDNVALKADQILAFYMCNDNTLCFSNNMRARNSQSYGGVNNLETDERPETANTYKAVTFKFLWNYYNTYNSGKGNAVVEFTKIYMPTVVKFTCTMTILDDNSIVVFKGYQE